MALLEGHDYERREELLARFDLQSQDASFRFDEQSIPVSIARGIAVHQPGEDYSETFQRADAAMYEHKSAIKARCKEDFQDDR